MVCSLYGNIAHVRGRSNVSAGTADNKSAADIAVCGNLVVGRADIDGTRYAHGINRYRAVGSAYCSIAVYCVHQRRSADPACNREVADAGNFGVAAYIVPYLHVLRIFNFERARIFGGNALRIRGFELALHVLQGYLPADVFGVERAERYGAVYSSRDIGGRERSVDIVCLHASGRINGDVC